MGLPHAFWRLLHNLSIVLRFPNIDVTAFIGPRNAILVVSDAEKSKQRSLKVHKKRTL